MNEFELIDAIVDVLGPAAEGGLLGPGDDCAVVPVPPGQLLVSSIDTLVSGVHFPADAAGELVGYRALMVTVSDLAAMGAEPAELLVALTLEETDQHWALAVAAGMREAIADTGGRILGGNLARGPRSLTLSVHGFCAEEDLLRRSGANPGDGIFVTGALGAAAAAVALGRLDDPSDPLTVRYFRPRARVDAGRVLRGRASAAIDLSDGLLQDLDHVCQASGVGAELESTAIPIAAGAELEHALGGGDDYELLFTAPEKPEGVGAWRIGTVAAAAGIRLDGEPAAIKGYVHFL